MNNLSADELATRLRAWAKGYYPSEAAVELLVSHQSWLWRRDFQDHLCRQLTHIVTDAPLVSVDWEGVEEFLAHAGASSSEDRILRIAGELAGTDSGTPLGELLSGLDHANTWLVLEAVARARGYRLTGDLHRLGR